MRKDDDGTIAETVSDIPTSTHWVVLTSETGSKDDNWGGTEKYTTMEYRWFDDESQWKKWIEVMHLTGRKSYRAFKVEKFARIKSTVEVDVD